MSDELDPRLETRLRAALRDEADVLPFTIRPGELERLVGQRRRARRTQRLSIVGLAAVVVLAVVGAAALAALRAPGPVASGKLATLPSYDRLIAAAGSGSGIEVLREESDALAGEGQWQYGLPRGIATFRIAVACVGGSLHLSTSVDGTPVDDLGTLTGACTGDVVTIGTGANPRLATASSPSVTLNAPGGTAWRMVVLAGGAAPSPAGMTPPPSTATPEPTAEPTPANPSLPPVDAGETSLVQLDLTAPDGTVVRTAARPAGTDSYRLHASCAGDGNLELVIDGVAGQYACGTIGLEEYTLGRGTQATIEATVTGGARFVIRLAAFDLAHVPGIKFVPPALSLTGPDWTAGDTVTVRGFPGCGLVWQPNGGGGSSTSCGPSWQPVATALTQRPGTTVTLSLPSGWTITDLGASIAANADILPSGRSPAEQPLAVTHSGIMWTFTVPAVGDWGIRLDVTATKNGDQFQIPFYGRIIVQP